jgi:hypothetical protein
MKLSLKKASRAVNTLTALLLVGLGCSKRYEPPKLQNKTFFFFYLLFVLPLSGCVRSGTQVTREVVSPNGKWDAIVMVRNGGAMTNFSTQISVVKAADSHAKQDALWSVGNVFIADDDHGAIAVDGNGQIKVKIAWASGTKLTIFYPEKTRVFKQETKLQTVTVDYRSF